jgi:SAM-dependent methyltransferase
LGRDPYSGVAQGWELHASLVYRPLALALVSRVPEGIRGLRVLDVGAGTGIGAELLREAGALPVQVDASLDMLLHRREERAPAVVGDGARLPFVDRVFDGVFAAFVLNHLAEPAAGVRELARVVRGGGVVLASVYADTSDNGPRDVVDEAARRAGFREPGWYTELRTRRAPQVGTTGKLAHAAEKAGLHVHECVAERIDVGVTTAEDVVRYRFGQAQYAPWFAGMSDDEAEEVRSKAVAAVRPVMTPYRPLVVLLSARKP